MNTPLLISTGQPKTIVKAFKHRLVLNPEQEKFIRQCLGQQRLLYNLCIDSRQNARIMKCSPPTKYDLHKQLTEMRNDPNYKWLKEVSIWAQRQGISNYFTAVSNFYKGKSNYPQYHKRKSIESFRIDRDFELGEQGNHAKYSRVRVPKAGWLKIKPSHQKLKQKNKLFEGEPISISLQRDGEHYYVNITSKITRKDNSQSSQATPRNAQEATKIPLIEANTIGIDLGITRSITLSDGTYYDLPVMTQRETERLARLNRKLAKQVKGSKNREKTKNKISRLHQRVRYRMNNAHHQISRQLVNKYDLIGIENLKVKQMSKNTSNTTERPGTNVTSKSGRNREIQKQGWYRLREMLEYKAAWKGTYVIAVPPHYSSQECSKCTHTEAGNRYTQSNFKCLSCGNSANADTNAAKVIRGRAIAKLTTLISSDALPKNIDTLIE